ncbi:uncharacterized protein At1g15400 [Durio zibethinus]|uniref:Uncharacterized protein At1g15400 n=1 Tax=Durio zibethinus TaxID=66656 RepID=A0A6P6BJ45_DURZI|nr:uncharacterized protein At1g15400 [Durio zibethinus]
MDGLQRSAVSFRRQGSSGLVWDDRFLSEELNQVKQEQEEGETKQDDQGQPQENNPEKFDVIKDVKPTRNVAPTPINTIERSQSNGERRGYRTGKVSPAIDPPSPKVSACGLCSAFGKHTKNHRKKPGKRRSR